MPTSDQKSPAFGWAIHALTASGVVVGLLGLLATIDGAAKAALIWLIVAQVIDGVDGPMARSYDTKKNCPRVDGYTLDLIVDFVTCILVPVAFLHQFDMLPSGISVLSAGLILFTSALWMSRTDQMTDDHWFRGFPCVWNLVIPSLYLLNTNQTVNTVVVLAFVAMTMTNIPFVHPMQVLAQRSMTMLIVVGWLGVMVYATVAFPHVPAWAALVMIAAPLYTGWLSLQRSLEDRREHAALAAARIIE